MFQGLELGLCSPKSIKLGQNNDYGGISLLNG